MYEHLHDFEQNLPLPYEPSCSFPQFSHIIVFYLFVIVVVPATTFLFTIIHKSCPKPMLAGTMMEWDIEMARVAGFGPAYDALTVRSRTS